MLGTQEEGEGEGGVCTHDRKEMQMAKFLKVVRWRVSSSVYPNCASVVVSSTPPSSSSSSSAAAMLNPCGQAVHDERRAWQARCSVVSAALTGREAQEGDPLGV